jgi:hypothetical protein
LREQSNAIERAQGGTVPASSSGFVASDRGLPLARSKVYVARDKRVAMQLFAMYASAQYAKCVARAFTDAASLRGTSTTYGRPRVGAIAVRRVGQEAVGYRITVPTTANGVTFDLRLDLIVIRRGRFVHVLLLGDTATLPLAAATRAAVLKAAGRLQATS